MTKKQTIRLSLIAIAVILVLLLGIVSVMTLNVSTDTAFAAEAVGNNFSVPTIRVSSVDYTYASNGVDNTIKITYGNTVEGIINYVSVDYSGLENPMTITYDPADNSSYFPFTYKYQTWDAEANNGDGAYGVELTSGLPTNVGKYLVSYYYESNYAFALHIEFIPQEIQAKICFHNTSTSIAGEFRDYNAQEFEFDVSLVDSAWDNKLAAITIEKWQWTNYQSVKTDVPMVFNAGTYANPTIMLDSLDQVTDANNYKAVWPGTFTINRINPTWSVVARGTWQFGEEVDELSDKMEMYFGVADIDDLMEVGGGAIDYTEISSATFTYEVDVGSDYVDSLSSKWILPGNYSARAYTTSTFTNYEIAGFIAGDVTISKAKVFVDEVSFVYDGNNKTPNPTFSLYTADGPEVSEYMGQAIAQLNGTPIARYEASEGSVNEYLYTFDVIIKDQANGGIFDKDTTPVDGQDFRNLFVLMDEQGNVDSDWVASYSWEIRRATVTISVSDLSKTYNKVEITAPTMANGKITLTNRPNGTYAENDEYFETPSGALSVSYAVKGNATSIEDVNLEWGTTLPVNAGTYYARVSMTTYKNYNASIGFVEFTIDKKSVGMSSTFPSSSSTYGDEITYFNRSVYSVGLETGDEDVEPIAERWYYSVKNPSFEKYPYNEEDANWIALSSNPFDRYSDVGVYWIFYVAEYANYATIKTDKIHTINNATITNVSIAQNVEENNALTYNGIEQTPVLDKSATTVNGVEYTFKYCKTSDGEFTTTVPTFTNASNSHTIYYKVEADNHTTYSSSFTIVINKAPLTITAENKETTYGSAAPAFTYTTSGFVHNETVAVLGGSIAYDCDYVIGNELKRNAGEYDICPKGFTSDNYDISFDLGILTVAQKTLTISFNGDKVFNGQNQKPSVIDITGEEYEDQIGVNFTGGDTITAGTWNNTISFELTGDKKDNYTCASFKTSLSIAAKPVNIIWTGLGGNTTYTGSEKTVTAAVDPESICAGYAVDVKTVTNNAKTNAGDYTAEVTELDNDNYTLVDATNVSYNWSIALAYITNYSATQDVVLTYNGSPQVGHFATSATTVNDQPVTFLYGLTTDGEFSTDVPAFTTAGSHGIYIKMTAPNHHPTGAVIQTSVNINKADKNMNGVSFLGDYNPYNGSVKTLQISGELPSGVSLVNYYVTDSVHTETNTVFEGQKYFGTYYVEARFAVNDTDNFNVPASMYAVLDIQKRTLTIEWSNTNPVYNGENQKPVATITNKQDANDDVSVAISLGVTKDATNVGWTWTKSDMLLSGDQKDSYDINNSEEVHFTIQQREVTVSFQNLVFTYNKQEQAPTIVLGNVVEIDSVKDDVSGVYAGDYGAKINANNNSEYTVIVGSLTGAKADNYKLPAEANRTGAFVINPKKVVFSWSATSLTYTGSPIRPEVSISSGIIDGDTVEITSVVGTQINVGTNYAAEVQALSNANYTAFESDNFVCEFSIVKANYDMSGISFTSDTKVFNGEEQGLEIVGTLPEGADEVTVTVAYSAGQTNVGSKVITATFSTTSGNYNVPASMEATITIVAKEVVVTIVDPTSLVYNNTEKTITATYNDVDEDPIAAVITYDEVDRINWTGTAFKAYAAITDTNYVVKADEAYTIENGKAMKSYTITKASYDMSDVTFVNGVKVFNGTEQGLLVGGTLPTGLDGIQVTVAYSAGQTNVGSKTITATFATTSTNYNVPASMEATLTINPKKVTLAWDNNTFEFDGNNHSVYATVGGTINNEEVTVTAYGGSKDCRNANEGVSTYNTTALTLSNNNYTLEGVENVTNTWTITKKAITVTFNSQHKEVTYGDTDAWEALGTEMATNNYYMVAALGAGDTIFDVVNITMVDKNSNPVVVYDETPAGTYYVAATDNGNTNYVVTVDLGAEAYLLVNKATLTVAVSPIANIVYGNSITVPTLNNGFTVTGWKNDDTDALIKAANASVQWINKGNFESFEELVDDPGFNPYTDVLNEQPEEYGTYYLVVAVGGLDNYEDGAFAYTSYRITKAIYDMSGVTFANINVVYDGTAKTATISGQLPDGVTVAYENNTRTVVGSQTATAKFTGDAENYEPIDDITCTITITARPITITADAKTSVYGSQFVALTAKLEGGVGAGDQEADLYVLSKAAGNVAGAYAITVTPANNANYAITVVNGTYTITAKPITVTADNKGSVYGKDIVALTATLSENALVGEDTAASVFTLSTTATKTSQPGEYPITVVLANNANYDVTVVNGKYTISEAAPVVNEAGVKEYNKEITVEEAVKGVSVTDLFKNAKNDTAETKEVVAKVGNASIAFNAAAIAAIGAADNISLKVDIVEGENIGEDAPKGALMVFNISLEGATFEDGTAIVEVPFDGKVPTGKEAKVFYVDENGKRTAMKTTYVDGVLAFETNHFSQYIVTYELTTATIAGIIVACVVVVAGIIVAVILVLKKKKGNGSKKAEEPKADDKVDVEETKAEEAAPASEEAPKDAE